MVSAVLNVDYKTILKLTYRAAKNMKHISRLNSKLFSRDSGRMQIPDYNWSALDLIHIFL